jgi:hypothetical protein
MGRKLSEMNSVLEYVTANMPDDCILFVMGDHGMTSTGQEFFLISELSNQSFLHLKAISIHGGLLNVD